MFYHRTLPNLKFEKNIFKSILDYALSSNAPWQRAYDCNGNKWNVEELILDINSFPILNEISDGLQNEFKRPSFFLSKVLPGGLVNHIDHRKWSSMIFPIFGPFDKSPILFLDQFNHIIEQHDFVLDQKGMYTPIIINTRVMHSVPLSDEIIEPRIALVMDLFDWPDHLFRKVDDDIIWKSTSHFDYQIDK